MLILLLAIRSTKVKCPFCDAVSNSIIEYRPSLLGYLLTLLGMLVLGFLSLILMPFFVSLTKTAIHRCAKCLNEVKDNSYFGLSSLDDKVSVSNEKTNLIHLSRCLHFQLETLESF